MGYIHEQAFDGVLYDIHDKRLNDSLNGLIKSDGEGNISVAIRGTDYDVPELPSQQGETNKFLMTDGQDLSWESVSGALPPQSGQNGKYLTTDGTDASWTTLNFPVSSVNNKTGAVTLTASDVGALPNSTYVPQNTSDLTNDSGFITSTDVENYGFAKIRENTTAGWNQQLTLISAADTIYVGVGFVLCLQLKRKKFNTLLDMY